MKIFSVNTYPARLQLDVFVCELLGSAFLMFFGCLGLYADVDRFAPPIPLKAGLIFGFLITAIATAIGYISGAHLNPCVTLCSILLGRIPTYIALLYMLADFLGCLLGTTLAIIMVPPDLYGLYDDHSQCGFCNTTIHPTLDLSQAFVMEFMGTFLLILCVCSASDARNAPWRGTNPVKFGLLIAMLAFTIGPFTGASLNPFRSFSPALLNNCWDDHWLYWVAPVSGTVAATLLYKFLFQENDSDTNAAQAKGANGQTNATKNLRRESTKSEIMRSRFLTGMI